jgi:hypothetical protein
VNQHGVSRSTKPAARPTVARTLGRERRSGKRASMAVDRIADDALNDGDLAIG